MENSPSSAGDNIAVANYSGYLPNGLIVPAGGQIKETNTPKWITSPDAKEDFATGIVALKYSSDEKNFVIDWENQTTQINSITAISTGSNIVYGVGAEKDSGNTFLYGFKLNNDNAGAKGDLQMKVELGKAPFRKTTKDKKGNVIIPRDDYKLRKGEVFDMGNQILILEDESLIISGGKSIIRVKARN